MDILKICKDDVGASDGELNEFLNNEITTHNGKCLLLCMMKSLGLVNVKINFDFNTIFQSDYSVFCS